MNLYGLKKLLFGQPDHHDVPIEVEDLPPEPTEQELILANIELGRKIDVIREQRKAIHTRLAEMKESA